MTGEIDPAEIGEDIADRPQRRLGDAIEEITEHGDDLVAGLPR